MGEFGLLLLLHLPLMCGLTERKIATDILLFQILCLFTIIALFITIKRLEIFPH